MSGFKFSTKEGYSGFITFHGTDGTMGLIISVYNMSGDYVRGTFRLSPSNLVVLKEPHRHSLFLVFLTHRIGQLIQELSAQEFSKIWEPR